MRTKIADSGPEHSVRQPDHAGDPWVFGYGSLMWRPGFAFAERAPALLSGFHRRFCVYSYYHRGTPQVPGLVLGLDLGGDCRGVAYRVARGDWPAVFAYLQERELVTDVYEPAQVRVQLDDGRQITALTYCVDRDHVQYAGQLSQDEQVRLIVQGEGNSGRNRDYLADMVAHLGEMGWDDAELTLLWRAVRRDCR